jgi:hypothetical protein
MSYAWGATFCVVGMKIPYFSLKFLRHCKFREKEAAGKKESLEKLHKGLYLKKSSCSFKSINAESGSSFELNGHVWKHKRRKAESFLEQNKK